MMAHVSVSVSKRSFVHVVTVKDLRQVNASVGKIVKKEITVTQSPS